MSPASLTPGLRALACRLALTLAAALTAPVMTAVTATLMATAAATPAAAQDPTPAASTEQDASRDQASRDQASRDQASRDQADSGQPPAMLDIDVTPQQIRVGERAQVQLTLVWMGEEPSEPARFPTWQETWGNAEVVGVGEIDAYVDQSTRFIYRQTVELTAFEVGEIRLPEVTVKLPLADRTLDVSTEEAATLEVVSVLPPPAEGEPAAAPEPRAAAPPMELPGVQQRFLLASAGLAVALLMSLWLLLGRLARSTGSAREGAVIDPFAGMSPIQELLHRLRDVDFEAGSEPAHTQLSFALRNFLGRSLGFQAVESTTSEIQRRLRSTAVPPAVSQRAVRLLRDCDQVKFARVSVDSVTTDDRLSLAENLGRQIDEILAPKEADPAAAPPATPDSASATAGSAVAASKGGSTKGAA